MNSDIVASLLGNVLAVPREMEYMPRWLRYRLVPRGDKVAKMPITLSGRPAKVNDPDTWGDYFDALWTRKGDGLGFVLGDGVGCVDLDNALTAEGELMPWAERIVEWAPETFMEISQSGRGLHIWGHLDEAPGRNLRTKGMSVEVYSGGAGQGRFIAMGQKEWHDSRPRLADLSDFAAELLS